MCRHRFGVLNDLLLELQSEGINDVSIMGINGYQYIDDSYEGMIEDRVLPWTQDIPEVDAWGLWDVTLRDFFILNREGEFVAKINLTYNNPDPNENCGNNYQLIKDLLIQTR